MVYSKVRSYIVILLSVIMVFVYSSFYIRNHEIYNSPDETAQAFFIERLANDESLAAPIKNFFDESVYIVPRSIRVVENSFVPASFLGLIAIYGAFASIFSMSTLYFFTGFVAVMGLLAYYRIIAHVWGEDVGFYSLLLAFIFPGWWYYASLAFFPNVLLATLFLGSIYFYIRYKDTKSNLFAVTSGLFTAAALFVRLAALPWIGITWVGLFFFDLLRKRRFMFRFFGIWTVLISLFLIAPILFIQKWLYGSVVETGYILVSETSSGGFITSLFPGGIHLSVMISNVWDYYIMLFWYITIPSVLGMLYVLIHIKTLLPIQKKYLLFSAVITIWLFIYYGSWTLTDNINSDTTIGVAYIRYWLLVFLLSLPFTVVLVGKFIESQKDVIVKKVLVIFALTLYSVLSIQSVYSRFDDSLASIEDTFTHNLSINKMVLASTEEDAVIISHRHDKVFFPDRDVIHLLLSGEDMAVISKITHNRSIYWYTFMEHDIIVKALATALEREGLMLVDILKSEGASLYEIKVK